VCIGQKSRLIDPGDIFCLQSAMMRVIWLEILIKQGEDIRDVVLNHGSRNGETRTDKFKVNAELDSVRLIDQHETRHSKIKIKSTSDDESEQTLIGVHVVLMRDSSVRMYSLRHPLGSLLLERVCQFSEKLTTPQRSTTAQMPYDHAQQSMQSPADVGSRKENTIIS
jgi:hypothetical protein